VSVRDCVQCVVCEMSATCLLDYMRFASGFGSVVCVMSCDAFFLCVMLVCAV